jgi:hypothetical protein
MGTDKESIENLRGINSYGNVFSEYQDQNPEGWTNIIEPVLAENGGWAAFAYTPKGENHGWDIYNQARHAPSWFSELLTIEDTVRDAEGEAGGPVIAQEYIQELRARATAEEIIQQEYYCFPPGIRVWTNNGQVPIEQISIGDIVLSHAGRWRRVTAVTSREYAGELVNIKSAGSPESLRLTGNHSIRTCAPSSQFYRWSAANQLKKGDYAVLPRLKLPCEPIISSGLAELLAWFIAEGSVAKTLVQFSLAGKETQFAERIEAAAKKFGKVSQNVLDNTLTVIVNSSWLADLLTSSCGSGAANKRIPWSLIAGHEQLVYDTLIDGDGCRGKYTSVSEVYTTISYGLALDMQMLAHMLGKRACVNKRPKEKGSCVIRGRSCVVSDSYSVRISVKRKTKCGRPKVRPQKHGIASLITDVSREVYEGLVYNLSVQYDESYIAEGRVVHNCSFKGYLRGTIYGDVLAQAEKDGRIGNVPWVSSLPVGLMWDIGRSDGTSIWFYQVHGSEIRFIDYYANLGGKGVDFYAKVCREKPYMYGKILLPHDAAVTGFSAIESTEEFLKKTLCRNVVVVKNEPGARQRGIDATRRMFSRFYFDEHHCSAVPSPGMVSGLTGLGNYHREWNEEYRDYSGQPVHDQHSHPADAIRIGMMGWQEGLDFGDAPMKPLIVETAFDLHTYRQSPAMAGR